MDDVGLPLLAAAPTVHAWRPRKVVLLSGLSDPSTCALSDEQVRFLKALPGDDAEKVYRNFPFVPCPERAVSAPPLWRASWHNYRQFRLASSEPYRRLALRHWQALGASCAELTVITLSCGLEIVRHLLAARTETPRVTIVALGPVARGRPGVSHCLIQGDCDWISRLYFRSADVTIPGLGHMTYLRHPDVLTEVSRCLWTSSST